MGSVILYDNKPKKAKKITKKIGNPGAEEVLSEFEPFCFVGFVTVALFLYGLVMAEYLEGIQYRKKAVTFVAVLVHNCLCCYNELQVKVRVP